VVRRGQGPVPTGRPPADLRRRGGQQRVPATALEDQAFGPRSGDGPGHHRLPLPAGDLEVEQDRASALEHGDDELAWTAADHVRSGGEPDRRDQDADRAERARRTRRGNLPGQDQGDRPRTTGGEPAATRVSSRLELHHRPKARSSGSAFGQSPSTAGRTTTSIPRGVPTTPRRRPSLSPPQAHSP
jgi:hypothetical protein